jgi:hypothetical protein
MSIKTIAKTYRFSAGLHALIVSDAERLKTTEADIVRLALRNYFDDRNKQDQLAGVEERVIARLDAQSQRIAKMLQQVMAMAQPTGGKNHGR